MKSTSPRRTAKQPPQLVPTLKREGAKQVALDESGRIICATSGEFLAELAPALRAARAPTSDWVGPLTLVGLIVLVASFVWLAAP